MDEDRANPPRARDPAEQKSLHLPGRESRINASRVVASDLRKSQMNFRVVFYEKNITSTRCSPLRPPPPPEKRAKMKNVKRAADQVKLRTLFDDRFDRVIRCPRAHGRRDTGFTIFFIPIRFPFALRCLHGGPGPIGSDPSSSPRLTDAGFGGPSGSRRERK